MYSGYNNVTIDMQTWCLLWKENTELRKYKSYSYNGTWVRCMVTSLCHQPAGANLRLCINLLPWHEIWPAAISYCLNTWSISWVGGIAVKPRLFLQFLSSNLMLTNMPYNACLLFSFIAPQIDQSSVCNFKKINKDHNYSTSNSLAGK